MPTWADWNASVTRSHGGWSPASANAMLKTVWADEVRAMLNDHSVLLNRQVYSPDVIVTTPAI